MAAAGLCALALAAGCVDELAGPGSGIPAPVTWMTWIGGISAGDNVSVRLLGTRPGCGAFEVHVAVAGSRIVIVPEESASPSLACLARDILFFYDTTITVAGLPPGSYTMEALTWSPFGNATRAFGLLVVTSGGVFDALLQAAGHGHLLADSLGCSWMRPEIQDPPFEPFVLATDVSLPAGWHAAFVSGGFLQSAPRCGQTQLYLVASAEVNPPPGVAGPVNRR